MRQMKVRSPLALLKAISSPSVVAALALGAATLLSTDPVAALMASFSAAGSSSGGGLSAADGEGRSPAYRDAQRALDQANWQEAAQRFASVADQKNSDADAALYWKAYAEEKLGRKSDALQSLKTLRALYPKSAWIDDADALEITLGGGSSGRGSSASSGGTDSREKQRTASDSEEDLQLYALDGLMQMDSQRALPILEKILAGNRSLQIKKRALFVLGQSGEPRARSILVTTAKSGNPPELQIEAVRALGIAGDPEDLTALSEIYRTTSSKETRETVLESFMVAGEEKPLLEAARNESDPALKSKAIELLGAMGSTASLAELYKGSTRDGKAKIMEGFMVGGDEERLLGIARDESDPVLSMKAIDLLGALGADKALVELYATRKDQGQREKIIDGLMAAGASKSLIALFRKETDPDLKRKMVQHLSMMQDDDAMDEIERLLSEKP
ncbi:MAG: HEAT repeat domain-containing protein [Thermoanaerobaculia bacterium]